MNDIGKVFKKLRREKNYTQAYSAKELMVTQPTIWRWESSQKAANEITVGMIEKMADLFEMPVIDFFKLITFDKREKKQTKESSNATTKI